MIRVAAIDSDGWQVVRGIRLRALDDAPDAFTARYDVEAGYDESAWRDRTYTGRWFVAMDDEDPVGVACGVEGWSADASERELVGMWVSPTHRGRGIARLLLERVAQWAEEVGASTLTLGVVKGNESARRAYLRMGMRLTGRTIPVWNDPSRLIEVLDRELGRAAGNDRRLDP